MPGQTDGQDWTWFATDAELDAMRVYIGYLERVAGSAARMPGVTRREAFVFARQWMEECRRTRAVLGACVEDRRLHGLPTIGGTGA